MKSLLIVVFLLVSPSFALGGNPIDYISDKYQVSYMNIDCRSGKWSISITIDAKPESFWISVHKGTLEGAMTTVLERVQEACKVLDCAPRE